MSCEGHDSPLKVGAMKPDLHAQWWPVALMCLVVASLGLTAVAASAEDTGQGRPPNIVFIMVDDLGKDWISCYGGDDIQTPHIDRLAREGMSFDKAWSMPQCTPTRATLLTGQYPYRTGWVNHWDVPRWGVGYFDWELNHTFARVLRSAGYRTAIAGKWQINDFRLEPEAMDKHGFDEWCLWTGYETGVPASAERYWDAYINTRDGSRTYKDQFGPDVYNRFLVDFIKENRDRPWMVYYPMALTHGPLVHTPDEMEAGDKWPRHKAMIRYMDKLTGQIVKAVDDSGQASDTLIIFTTDNGSGGGVYGTVGGVAPSGGKATMFEGGVCQPFIARWKGVVEPGSRSDALTDFSDLFPTFIELAGAGIPDGLAVDGHSFADVLRGKSDVGHRDWILSMGYGPAARDVSGVRGVLDYAPRVIRDHQFKVWVSPDAKIEKFFDLKNDPYERTNMLDGGQLNAAAAASMRKFQSVVDSMPLKDARPRYRPRAATPWDRPVNYPKPENK